MLEVVKLPCEVQTTKGLTNHATLDGLSSRSGHVKSEIKRKIVSSKEKFKTSRRMIGSSFA